MSGQMVLRIYRVKLKLYPTEKENSTSEQIGSFLTKRLVCHAWPQSSATEVKRAVTQQLPQYFTARKLVSQHYVDCSPQSRRDLSEP